MDIETYEILVRRALEAGVPPGVVAGIFELTTDVAKELQRQVRVERYGTADMAEYLDSIQFQTLERAQQLLEGGSAEQAARIVNSVFGRQLANAGKRPSSALEEQRAELMAAMKGVREGSAVREGPGRFVMGRTDVDRRAHRVEDDDDE